MVYFLPMGTQGPQLKVWMDACSEMVADSLVLSCWFSPGLMIASFVGSEKYKIVLLFTKLMSTTTNSTVTVKQISDVSKSIPQMSPPPQPLSPQLQLSQPVTKTNH